MRNIVIAATLVIGLLGAGTFRWFRLAPERQLAASLVDVHTPRGKAIADELRQPTVYGDCEGHGDTVPTYPPDHGFNFSATCEDGIWLVDGAKAPTAIERAIAYVDAREEFRIYKLKCPTGCGWSPVQSVNVGTLMSGESVTVEMPITVGREASKQ